MELIQDGHFWLIKDGEELVARISGSLRFAERHMAELEKAKPEEPKPVAKTKKKAAKKKVSKKK